MLLPSAVLIVNYLVYEDLDRALASLEPWLRADDEIVVVDQASDALRLAQIQARHPRARCVPLRENTGFAAGVNLAARHATAPYLLLLNPDTVVEGDVMSVLSDWLASHPDVGIVGPRVRNADGSVQPSARRFPGVSTVFGGRSTWLTRRFPGNWFSERNLPGRDSDAPCVVDWIAGSCLMTRRDLFNRLGGFDEGFFLYWEDADYCRRASALGFRSVYLPQVVVRHAGGRSAERDAGPAIRAFHRSAYRLSQKYAGPVGRMLAPAIRLALWTRGELRARRASRRWRAGGNSGATRPAE